MALLGSTGSIGTQALDVVRAAGAQGAEPPFRVVALAAGGADVAALAGQALEHGVALVGVAREEARGPLEEALRARAAGRPLPRVVAGPDAATEVAAHPCDVVLNGMTGSVGLRPTLAALAAGRTLALANKESLVAGGPLVTRAAAPGQVVPVDSEHSALAQCLRGGAGDEVARLVLTASGGPFRGRTRAQLADVTPEQALAHPTWSMGPVVTTNSATLVNKGLEVIEASLLFGIDYDRIDVVVHPQSVVHSMVEFTDGSTLAQCSPPDMRLPIALGLSWPDRVPGAAAGIDWTRAASWTFEPVDAQAFPALDLAREAGRRGSTVPAVFNAANEECVAAFHAGRLPFLGIVDTLARVVAEHEPAGEPRDVEDVLAAEDWARTRARELHGRVVAVSEVLLWVVGILAAAVGVALSIALHEVGHLLPAKRFGIKVTQYMVGFGPTLFSRRRGETEYGVKAVPLGGYIRMIGMFPPGPDGQVRASSTGRWALMAEEARQASFVEVAPGEEHRTFTSKPVWQRIVVMFGGPFVNLLLALVLTAIAASAIGQPGYVPRLSAVSQCVLPAGSTATTCSAGDPVAPGAAAGLRPGDEVVEFDGAPVRSWDQLSAAIRDHGGRAVDLVVLRDGQRVPLTVTPVSTRREAVDANGRPTGGTEEVGFLGVSPSIAVVRIGLDEVPGVVGRQVESVAGIVVRLPQRLYDVAQAAFGSAPRDPEGPIGIVGIGRLAGEANALPAVIPGDELAERTSRLVSLLAGLNVALFVFNLVPLLPFDGGHIAGALWEVVKKGIFRLRRRPDPGPVDVAKAMPVAYGVSILLVGMSVLLLYADIVRPVTLNQ